MYQGKTLAAQSMALFRPTCTPWLDLTMLRTLAQLQKPRKIRAESSIRPSVCRILRITCRWPAHRSWRILQDLSHPDRGWLGLASALLVIDGGAVSYRLDRRGCRLRGRVVSLGDEVGEPPGLPDIASSP